MANKKDFAGDGEPKGSPLVSVRALIKMVYAGHTVFPGSVMACDERLAKDLIKANMAEELDPSVPLTATLTAPRNAMLPRAKPRGRRPR